MIDPDLIELIVWIVSITMALSILLIWFQVIFGALRFVAWLIERAERRYGRERTR